MQVEELRAKVERLHAQLNELIRQIDLMPDAKITAEVIKAVRDEERDRCLDLINGLAWGFSILADRLATMGLDRSALAGDINAFIESDPDLSEPTRFALGLLSGLVGARPL